VLIFSVHTISFPKGAVVDMANKTDNRPNSPKPKHAVNPVCSVQTLSFEKGFFIAADHQFGRQEIIGYFDRPFNSVTAMDAMMIQNHNNIVGKDDDVLFLGDFMWGRKTSLQTVLPRMQQVLSQMNGRKFLIRGNHDYFYPQDYLNAGFLDVQELAVIDGVTFIHSPKQLFLQNIPNFTDMPAGYALVAKGNLGSNIPGEYVCGHVHNMWKVLCPFVNVSVDIWNFAPVHSSDVRNLLSTIRQPGHGFQNLGKLVVDAMQNL